MVSLCSCIGAIGPWRRWRRTLDCCAGVECGCAALWLPPCSPGPSCAPFYSTSGTSRPLTACSRTSCRTRRTRPVRNPLHGLMPLRRLPRMSSMHIALKPARGLVAGTHVAAAPPPLLPLPPCRRAVLEGWGGPGRQCQSVREAAGDVGAAQAHRGGAAQRAGRGGRREPHVGRRSHRHRVAAVSAALAWDAAARCPPLLQLAAVEQPRGLGVTSLLRPAWRSLPHAALTASWRRTPRSTLCTATSTCACRRVAAGRPGGLHRQQARTLRRAPRRPGFSAKTGGSSWLSPAAAVNPPADHPVVGCERGAGAGGGAAHDAGHFWHRGAGHGGGGGKGAG